jgi:hypothetical protein
MEKEIILGGEIMSAKQMKDYIRYLEEKAEGIRYQIDRAHKNNTYKDLRVIDLSNLHIILQYIKLAYDESLKKD